MVPSGLTVRELVGHGRYAHRGVLGRTTGDDLEAVRWALAVTGLEPLAGRRVEELSGGERQRAWIAVVLAQKTGVLLLDEPTTFLDLRYQIEILALVRRLADEHGLTVGVVLHDLNQGRRVRRQDRHAQRRPGGRVGRAARGDHRRGRQGRLRARGERRHRPRDRPSHLPAVPARASHHQGVVPPC
ncbi:ABC transporter ATP-binding protein [Nonomuraea dietziae]|uniref:ABC transporter ATP-binding protein n=1 Tax=Nonomuraea dietziae TaxID=65515 RepID=UPI0031D16B2B